METAGAPWCEVKTIMRVNSKYLMNFSSDYQNMIKKGDKNIFLNKSTVNYYQQKFKNIFSQPYTL